MLHIMMLPLRRYADFRGRSGREEFWLLMIAPILLHSLCILIPALAATVRRLHDMDRSGWNIFIGLIPLVGSIFLLLWHATPGTRGPNRYGPAPQADGAAAA